MEDKTAFKEQTDRVIAAVKAALPTLEGESRNIDDFRARAKAFMNSVAYLQRGDETQTFDLRQAQQDFLQDGHRFLQQFERLPRDLPDNAKDGLLAVAVAISHVAEQAPEALHNQQKLIAKAFGAAYAHVLDREKEQYRLSG